MPPPLLLHIDTPIPRSRTPMRGNVRIRPTEDCFCEKLSIDQQFIIRHQLRQDVDRYHLGHTLVEGAKWAAGQELAIPFEFAAPGFPPSYDGALFSVQWELRAVMKLAGEEPVVVAQPFRLLPAQDAGLVARPKTPADRNALTQVKNTAVIAAVVVAVVGLGLAASGYVIDSWWLMIPCAILGAFGLLSTALAIGQVRLRRRIGNVQVDISGQTCTVWTLPNAAVERVEMRLVAEEIVVTGFTDSKKTHIHKRIDEKTSLSLVSPGAYEGPLPIAASDDLPYSMNHIKWSAVAEVHVKGGGTVDSKVALVVLPARGSGSEGEGRGDPDAQAGADVFAQS